MSNGKVTPICLASFLPQSYNPKANIPAATAKTVSKQSAFNDILSAVITDASSTPTGMSIQAGKIESAINTIRPALRINDEWEVS